MKRKIITINEDKCNGCGLCVNACHEGALQMVNGKAKLVSESYCDGLGDCLPKCPAGAIAIVEREVAAFDKEAVEKHLAQKKTAESPVPCTCPSNSAKTLKRSAAISATPVRERESELRQWPCQIQLVPVNAPYFDGAKLLVAADCTAFANANVHDKFMKNKITLIGCPKLDPVNYADKLMQILSNNDIKSVDILRMSVPCCGGIENAVKKALVGSGKMIPWSVIVIDTNGGMSE